MSKHTPRALALLLAALLLAACGPASRRSEIEQRREALLHKQDSALAEAQRELEQADRDLQQAQARYDLLLEEMHQGDLSDDMAQRLTEARLERDSLQQRFDVIGAKIRYIHRRQQELRGDSTQSATQR